MPFRLAAGEAAADGLTWPSLGLRLPSLISPGRSSFDAPRSRPPVGSRSPQSGTLNTLLTLSESLPKTDAFFTTTVSKLLDTLRTLLGDDAAKLEAHTRVNDRPLEEYLFPASGSGGWKWDRRRWGADGKVVDVVDSLNKVSLASSSRARACRVGHLLSLAFSDRGANPFASRARLPPTPQELTSIDNMQKSRLQSYNLAKGHLTSLQRKLTCVPVAQPSSLAAPRATLACPADLISPLSPRSGNLSTKSLTEIVKPSDVKTGDSEFLETIFVAVPKCVPPAAPRPADAAPDTDGLRFPDPPSNIVKDWHAKYERLAPMVVPRSSSYVRVCLLALGSPAAEL